MAKPGVLPAGRKCTYKTQGLLDQSSPNFFIRHQGLMRTSMSRSSHPLWNVSADNEDGVWQFLLIHAKMGYHSNVP